MTPALWWGGSGHGQCPEAPRSYHHFASERGTEAHPPEADGPFGRVSGEKARNQAIMLSSKPGDGDSTGSCGFVAGLLGRRAATTSRSPL